MAALTVVGRAAALGVVAGMRTMAAPAAVSRHLASGGPEMDGGLERLLAHPAAPWVLGIASAAEHVADKLPGTPNRTDAGPLGARIASGALCGAVVARRAGEPVAVGALAAAAATFAAFEIRHALTADAGLPDLPVALAEDFGAVVLAEVALRD
ncbi:MAG TPA: DUF4126 family protein [Longimicrobium sp.]|jgi:uncharacterized membrane protein|nr:DUF4126 family protein [Longimicrobium sp.]